MEWAGLALIYNTRRIEIPFTASGGSTRSGAGSKDTTGDLPAGATGIAGSPAGRKSIYTVNENLAIADARLLFAWIMEQDAGNAGLIQFEDYWRRVTAEFIAQRSRVAIGTPFDENGYTWSFYRGFGVIKPNGEVFGQPASGGGQVLQRCTFTFEEI